MKTLLMSFAILVSLLGFKVLAEDIDLFVGVPVQTSGKANVLLMIDNTSNWSTAFEDEKKAFSAVFSDLDPNAFQVGIAMYGESPTMGYIRAAIRDMGKKAKDVNDEEQYYKDLYGQMIFAFQDGGSLGDNTNNRAISGSFGEIYRYLNGFPSVDTSSNTGIGKNNKRDWFENDYNKVTPETALIYNLGENALDDERSSTYNKPPDAGVCASTYVIYVGNTNASGTVTTESTTSLTTAYAALESAGGSDALKTITAGFEMDSKYNNNAFRDSWADEWARYMHEEMGVIFYALDVLPVAHPDYDDGAEGKSRGMGNSELLRSLSQNVGGGKYIRINDPNNIEAGLKRIFNEIQATNSVFASVALPASTAGNSLFLNQVFVGLFRPDENAKPKWPGNLKQYKLTRAGDTLKLTDANDAFAINTTSGFIDDCARSYWTSSSSDTYWSFDPRGTCAPATKENQSKSDSPDGPYVEKGAQAYRLRQGSYTGTDGRTVYSCGTGYSSGVANCSSGNMPSFSSVGDIPDANDATDESNIIDWVYGKDVFNINGDKTGTEPNTSDTRAYVHGDVIHSRPIAINYGTDDAPIVIVFYGGNDGMLRAVNGSQSDDLVLNGSTFKPGDEIWSFMPPEFWGDIKRLYVNTDTVKVPATAPGFESRPGSLKNYGMDGPITLWEDSANDTKYLYAGMRRGGRSLYAFDVSDPKDPLKLLWKKGCQDGVCDGDTTGDGQGWGDIGETWSPANVAFLQGRANPFLIMGGGYDTCEDYDGGTGLKNHSCTVNPITAGSERTLNQKSEIGETGDHIYVIDSVTGDLLAVFDTERPVPGSVTIVPVSDSNSDIAFAYAADAGGNIYRLSGAAGVPINAATDPNDPTTWKLEKIAAFGCGSKADSSCASGPNRKFLFGPDVVRDIAEANVYRVLAGTGDREKPLAAYSATTSVDNYFYSFVDKPGDSDWIDVDGGTECKENVFCMDVLFSVTTLTKDGVSESDLAGKKGFSVKLANDEQVVTSSLVVGDIATFSTHIPVDPNELKDEDGDICRNNLGTATTYNIDFEQAGGEGTDIKTGGLVPSPVAGKVLICENGTCSPEDFCIGCGGENSPIGGSTPTSASDFEQSKGRVYWRIEE